MQKQLYYSSNSYNCNYGTILLQENKTKDTQRHAPSAVLMSNHWRPFSICLLLAALLQLSGYNVFIYYSVIIFDIIAPDIMHPYDPSILAVCVMFVSYIFVLTVSYRIKRRHLLLISMLGMAGLHFILGKFMSIYLQKLWSQVYLKQQSD